MKKASKRRLDIIRRYNRLAWIYDWLEAPMEWLRFAKWRTRLSEQMVGTRVLEVGVGTGKNLPYYPHDKDVVAIDFSHRMLSKAEKKDLLRGGGVSFHEMDVQDLKFPDQTFDTVFATFVFCMENIQKAGWHIQLEEHLSSDIVRWVEARP